jgi:general secretion pathway protein K
MKVLMREPVNERGSALMSVLWIVLVLSLVSFSLAATVRVEVESIKQTFDSEKAFFMARGAAEIVFDSFSKHQPLPADSPVRQENGEYFFPFKDGEAVVRFESEAGRIDINQASDVLLATMLNSLQVDRETRNHIVDSILDWIDSDDIPHLYGGEVADYPPVAPGQDARPRNGKFLSVDEILLVRNMTPEIFFGSLAVDSVTGQYRKIPGLRDLITVKTGDFKVDANEAPEVVLSALPGMNEQLVQQVVAERSTQLFTSLDDLGARVPGLSLGDSLGYFRFGGSLPTELVARGTVKTSGIARTVRLLFKRSERMNIIRTAPLLYTKVEEIKFDRWRFD